MLLRENRNQRLLIVPYRGIQNPWREKGEPLLHVTAVQRKRRGAKRGVEEAGVIRKLQSGKYRLYSRKKNSKTGRRRNLGTFPSRRAAEVTNEAVQYFKHR